jgi:hypothetical protein
MLCGCGRGAEHFAPHFIADSVACFYDSHRDDFVLKLVRELAADFGRLSGNFPRGRHIGKFWKSSIILPFGQGKCCVGGGPFPQTTALLAQDDHLLEEGLYVVADLCRRHRARYIEAADTESVIGAPRFSIRNFFRTQVGDCLMAIR